MKVLYPEKLSFITYISFDNKPTFWNMQEHKTFYSHESILKKLRELSNHPRDEWKIIAKAHGETLNLFKWRNRTKPSWDS